LALQPYVGAAVLGGLPYDLSAAACPLLFRATRARSKSSGSGKRRQARPEEMNKVENSVYYVEQKRILPRINSGKERVSAQNQGPAAGPAGSPGPEYRREDPLSGALDFRTSAETEPIIRNVTDTESAGGSLAARSRGGRDHGRG